MVGMSACAYLESNEKRNLTHIIPDLVGDFCLPPPPSAPPPNSARKVLVVIQTITAEFGGGRVGVETTTKQKYFGYWWVLIRWNEHRLLDHQSNLGNRKSFEKGIIHANRTNHSALPPLQRTP